MLAQNTQHNWKKIYAIMPLFAFIVFGYVLSQIAGNVLFVKRVGSEFLPYTYVANAVLGFGVSFFVASMVERINLMRLLQILSLFSAGILTAVIFMMKVDIVLAYPILLVFTQLCYIVFAGLLMWNVALKICSPIEGKWAFGYYSMGASIGGVVAGILSSFISDRFGTEALVPVIVGSLILVFLNSIVVGYFFPENFKLVNGSEKQSPLESLKEAFKYYRNSRVAKILSTVLVLFATVRLIGDFEFQKIMGDNLSEEQFSKVMGYVSIVENASLIFIFLFAQKWILNRFGVYNTFFASPILVVAPFILLLFYPFYLIAAGLKLFVKIVNYSTLNSSVRLILTSIPHKVRSSVSAFIGGNAESGGAFAAGTLLIFITKFLPNSLVIATGIFLLAIIIYLAYRMKKEYVSQILKNLFNGDVEDVHTSIENLAERVYRKIGVQELMKMLERKDLDLETVRKIVFALGKIDNVNVIPSLIEIFQRHDITVKYAVIEAIHGFTKLNQRLQQIPFTRLNLIEFYQRIFLEEEDSNLKIFILEHLKDFDPDNVIIFLKEATTHCDPMIQYQAIKAMKYFDDRGIIKYVRQFLKNENVMVRASAIIALWQFTELRLELISEFIRINVSNRKDCILATLFIVSKLNFHWESRFVEQNLKNSDPEIRAMASLTLMEINNLLGLEIYIHSLLGNEKFSLVMTRNIKNLPTEVKTKLLKKIKESGEIAINCCIKKMEESHLNFTEEIKYLSDSDNSRVNRKLRIF